MDDGQETSHLHLATPRVGGGATSNARLYQEPFAASETQRYRMGPTRRLQEHKVGSVSNREESLGNFFFFFFFFWGGGGMDGDGNGVWLTIVTVTLLLWIGGDGGIKGGE